MKKYVKFLLPFLVVSSALVGCNDKKDNSDSRVLLSYGDINANAITQIDATELKTRISYEESFIFVVYDGTCGCWRDFRDGLLEPYIKENKVIAYVMPLGEFKSANLSGTIGIIPTNGSSSLVIFENGKVKKTLSTDTSKEMKDKNAFYSFMNSTVKLPKAYLISEANANAMMESDKTSLIYFERSQCGDCNLVNRTILKRYLNSYEGDKKLYILDCQPWKSLSNEAYQTKKDTYGLSTVNNPTYGFDTGVFPFFSLVSNKQYISGAVAFNDSLKEENGKVVVDNTYYSTVRQSSLEYVKDLDVKALEGVEVKEEDRVYTTRYKWSEEASIKAYEPFIKAFLDYALAKQTFTF